MTLDRKTALDFAVRVARDAGEILLHHFNNPQPYTSKSTRSDIVTVADREAEEAIVRAIVAAYPHTHIVGEEGGSQGAPASEAEYFWYVDPIDGTVNFASQLPYFSVCIALADRNRQPILGVVYDPIRAEFFTGIAGEGAVLNGKPLRVTQTRELADALVCSGFPYDKHIDPDNNLREWAALMTRVRDLRRLGSAALDMCYVAAGRLDAFWEQKLNPWDVMAGMLFVREAGGMVTDYDGQPNPQQRDKGYYVASNGHLHQVLCEAITAARA